MHFCWRVEKTIENLLKTKIPVRWIIGHRSVYRRFVNPPVQAMSIPYKTRSWEDRGLRWKLQELFGQLCLSQRVHGTDKNSDGCIWWERRSFRIIRFRSAAWYLLDKNLLPVKVRSLIGVCTKWIPSEVKYSQDNTNWTTYYVTRLHNKSLCVCLHDEVGRLMLCLVTTPYR